jgi:hypothetical protein
MALSTVAAWKLMEQIVRSNPDQALILRLNQTSAILAPTLSPSPLENYLNSVLVRFYLVPSLAED